MTSAPTADQNNSLYGIPAIISLACNQQNVTLNRQQNL